MSTPFALFHRILIATDDSAAGVAAAALGRRIAEREGSTLFLLHVESERTPLPQVFADTASLRQQSSDMREAGVHA